MVRKQSNVPYEDNIKLLKGVIEGQKACTQSYANPTVAEQDIQDKCLRESRILHCRGVLEYIANTGCTGDREGVQPKLNRIADRESFRSTLKELCAELKISEGTVEQSRQTIYEWFCKYAHTGEGFNCLTINTGNTDYPTSIAVSYLAYLRELKIKHSYVIGEKVLKWPSP
ncbi:hypothetical protein L211DRAFT_844972 [Terfezia boudieri ATCC MYA-4762]|uniref:Uncharacterized protein n=1 Tax=Terfezia boudieri ATCC MYA-4762 TaxID=1051890 RepID=A0A3N4M841_9PEZI|nr:hypothetical protein L211DRAFT_844972 [Terfezia boudieri ATCC MYA-4762]